MNEMESGVVHKIKFAAVLIPLSSDSRIPVRAGPLLV